MKKTQAWLFVSLFMLGCTHEVEEAAEGPLGAAHGPLSAQNSIDPNSIDPNSIDPNSIDPNSIDPNSIDPNALTPGTLSSTSMTALQNPGEAGRMSRMLVQYLVSCAFDNTQSFSFTWSDDDGPHSEEYWGSMGLVPEWEERGLTLTEQRWVSACIAARTNMYGVPVMISMRGTHAALGLEEGESGTYTFQEGAFWGNIFGDAPDLKSCYFANKVTESRAEQRFCAARTADSIECNNIDSVGPCTISPVDPALCVLRTDSPSDGYVTCGGESEVITTFLNPL
jgi:hypothetical protein